MDGLQTLDGPIELPSSSERARAPVAPPAAFDAGAPSLAARLAALTPVERHRLALSLAGMRLREIPTWTARHRTFPLLARSVERSAWGADGAAPEHAEQSWVEYRRRFVWGLLYALERGLRSGRTEFLHVYRAERRRHYDALGPEPGVEAELESLLADDRRVLLSCAARLPQRTRTRFGALLDALHAPIIRRGGTEITVAMMGDCLMTEIKTSLVPALREAGLEIAPRQFFFNAQAVALDTGEIADAVAAARIDLIVMSFLTLEGLPLYRSLLHDAAALGADELVRRCDQLLGVIDAFVASIRQRTDATFVLHGCSGLPLALPRQFNRLTAPIAPAQLQVVQRLDAGLAQMANATENCVFLDEAGLVGAAGMRRINARLFPLLATRFKTMYHPSGLGPLLAEEYSEIIRAHAALSKTKVLLVDFDNTLWSGVMGDGEVVHDHRAQRLLKQLREAGILLVAVSKNDPETIRWDELTLAREDFVLQKISWNPKPQSVAETAGQLDLDPASFVLLDDNPVERQLVTSVHPEVLALDPADPQTWRWLELMLDFPNTRQTEESAARTAMYREAAERRSVLSGELDYAKLMADLQLVSEWRRAGSADLDRVHELISRTNQFNTTTQRLTRPQIATLLEAPHQDVWVATLADRFGALGLVGVVITRTQGSTLVYEAVVMSCRAMGFGLESQLLAGPLEHTSATTAVGRYVRSERNSPCASLFTSNGFVAGDEAGEFILDLADLRPVAPAWLRILHR